MSTITLHRPIAPVNAPWRPETEITWEQALRYRGWGWSVLPLYRKRPAARRIGWKHHQSGQCGEDRLRGEWGRSPIVDGVGVVGFVSGVAVVDFDDAEAYRRWAEADPETAARCPTVRTCWGYHVYHRPRVECWFRHEAGEYIADRRHYFVAALSRHDTGIIYEWVGTDPAGPEAFPLLGPEDFGLRPPASQKGDRKPPARRPAYPPPQSPPREISEWRAVRLSVPTREGERNHKLWELARRAKFAPGADPWAMFQSWWECAEGVVGTADEAVSRRDFGRMLKLVQRPHGEGFREAASAVVNGPLPERVGPYTDLPTRKLAALCRALQAHAGPNKPFPLSGRLAAELCGFAGQRGASRRIRQLEPYGLRKAKGCTRTLAAEYLFVPPPEPPSTLTSCETTSESQTCPVLSAARQAGGWDKGYRAMALLTGLSFRSVRAAFARAVASGELVPTEGKGRRAAAYGIPGALDERQAAIPPAVGSSAVAAGAPHPEPEAVDPPPAPRPVPVSAGRLGPNRMKNLRDLPPLPPPPPPTGTPLERLEELVRSSPNGVYLIGGAEVCPFEEIIAGRIGTTAGEVGALAAELVARGLIRRCFEPPEAGVPEAWEMFVGA